MSAVADLAFVRARSEASARFVSENSERISWLCHRMSERFLDGGRLPEPLKAFAKVNPFTIVVDAMRHLWLGAPAGDSVWARWCGRS